MRLRVEDLSDLKKDFERYEPDGLSLEAFVSVLMDRLAWTESTAVDLVFDLVDLFGQIVINDNGTMVWEDFTNAMIEVGMGTALEEHEWRDMKYEENVCYTDKTSRQPRHVQYISELRKLFVFEGNRPVLQVKKPEIPFCKQNSFDLGL